MDILIDAALVGSGFLCGVAAIYYTRPRLLVHLECGAGGRWRWYADDGEKVAQCMPHGYETADEAAEAARALFPRCIVRVGE